MYLFNDVCYQNLCINTAQVMGKQVIVPSSTEVQLMSTVELTCEMCGTIGYMSQAKLPSVSVHGSK